MSTLGKSTLRIALLCVFLSGCGTISTYQTGKTLPRGQFSFGIGMAGGLFRTKSRAVGFPIELGYGAAEVMLGYGVFDFIELDAKVMAATFTDSEEFGHLSGIPAFGGGQVRVPLAQERWGFPFSLSLGTGYYAGSAQSIQQDINKVETRRDLTVTKDQIHTLFLSKDLKPWFTPYIAYKLVRRTTVNRRYDHGKLTINETLVDPMHGFGSGFSFNVGRSRNTHIMLELNSVRDNDEPDKHYQKQGGLGMSVDF